MITLLLSSKLETHENHYLLSTSLFDIPSNRVDRSILKPLGRRAVIKRGRLLLTHLGWTLGRLGMP